MTPITEVPPSTLDTPTVARWRNVFGLITLLFGVITLLGPLGHEEVVGGRAGLLLVLTALLEFAHGFRRATKAAQRSAWVGGAITLAMGLLLLNAPFITVRALGIFFAGWFGLDGIRYLILTTSRSGRETSRWYCVLAAMGNLLVCAGIIVFRTQALPWTVAIAAALRIFGVASNIFVVPVYSPQDSGKTVIDDLGLPENKELRDHAQRIQDAESSRTTIDRGWIIGFILTLFAIHLGRMGLDRTLLGIVSPGVAVIGDIFIGLLLAFVIIIPVHVLWLKLTRGLERRAWTWVLHQPPDQRRWGRKIAQALLFVRLQSAIRLRRMRYSFTRAVNRALQVGLPLAAIVAATFPVWGMSWYFDTENWAAGIWNSYAAARTDSWREAMTIAVMDQDKPKDPAQSFAVFPPGVMSHGDFSFIVIGDTGEGDASQHVLRGQYLEVVKRNEVKFVIVSSDVIYPTGGMRDYEARFWLPFMGTTKPVYAIPGNHDWYDALEGFVATFLEPNAARAAMRARIEVDHKITTTTERHIDYLIGEASRLGREYRVPTQLQKGPFFQLQTGTFALFAIDTGIVKRLDIVQMQWLRRALEAARGKTKMAIVGHPLFAGGEYLAEGNADFLALHQLLREHDVAIVMGGDTHDLEYYLESRPGKAALHHFVNGGGGAYLSFGTSLAWPAEVPADQWAYYPAKAQVVDKIEATTPAWKWPAWWWTKHMGGWPFSPEFLSAAFDVNAAPYYQSFMEVRVENSKNRVVLIPYGVHGRLCWKDLDHSSKIIPPGANADSLVEWIVEMQK